jgi:hypothetical protein
MTTCSHDDCEKPARWRPALDLRTRKDARPTRARFEQLAYCDEHHRSLHLDAFLCDEGFTKLTKHVREAGKPVPNKLCTTLAWEPLADDELGGDDQQRTRTAEEPLPF